MKAILSFQVFQGLHQGMKTENEFLSLLHIVVQQLENGDKLQ